MTGCFWSSRWRERPQQIRTFRLADAARRSGPACREDLEESLDLSGELHGSRGRSRAVPRQQTPLGSSVSSEVWRHRRCARATCPKPGARRCFSSGRLVFGPQGSQHADRNALAEHVVGLGASPASDSTLLCPARGITAPPGGLPVEHQRARFFIASPRRRTALSSESCSMEARSFSMAA